MYGPLWPLYSCMGLMTLDTRFSRVDGLSTRHPGIWGGHTAWKEGRLLMYRKGGPTKG